MDNVPIANVREVGARRPPLLDLKTTVVPEGSQDWQLLVTDGHVRGHRLLDVGRKLLLPAVTLGLVGGWLCFSAVTGTGAGLRAPAWLAGAVTYDPAHYATIPGSDEKTDYRLSWLAGAVGTPQRGLTEEGWKALLIAASLDVNRFGDKVDSYQEVPKLATAPLVTRPDKAFREHADALASGLIAIPQASRQVAAYVAAWVDGKLAVSAFGLAARGGGCVAVLGPIVEGCTRPADPTPVLDALRPQETK